MIIKGRIRTDGAKLGDYLLSEGRYAKNQGENERIEVWEALGSEKGVTLQELLASHELSAEPTRCGKPLFHVQLRTAEGEELTRAQWLQAADRLEQRLGLADHERVLVAHTKDGQEHLHIVWNRIDRAEQIAAPLHYYKHKCTDVARELERDFGLRQLAPARGRGKLSRDEEQQALRQEAKPQEIREAIQACWAQADDGKSFAAALQERGFLLAKGDRRDYVAVDERGGTYSIGKRTTGAPAKAVRERLADLAQAKLPSVAEAQARQREAMQQRESAETDLMAEQKARNYEELRQARQQAQQEEEQRKGEAQQEEEHKKAAAEQEEQQKQAGFREEEEWKQQAQQEEDRRQTFFREEEQRKQQAQQEEARRQESARVERLAKENRDEQVRQAEAMRWRAEEAEKSRVRQEQAERAARAERLAQEKQAEEMRRQAEVAERLRGHQEQVAREAAQARERAAAERAQAQAYREGEISSARHRYDHALQHYDIRDPYGSLAGCAMVEHAAFMSERQELDRRIAATKDQTAREALELRKRIEGMEYLAITSERIAEQSEVITGERNGVEAQKQRARAADYQQQAKALRQEWREAQARREMEQEAKQEKARQEKTQREEARQQAAASRGKKATPETRRDDHGPPPPPAASPEKGAAQEAKQKETQRQAAASPPPKEAAQETRPLMVQDKQRQQKRLVDFVRSEVKTSSNITVRHDVAAIVETRRRNEGLDGISRSMKAGLPLAAEDVDKLKSVDWQGIRRSGDAYLHEAVKQREAERQRDNDRGRERER